jgi:hypothetical protein
MNRLLSWTYRGFALLGFVAGFSVQAQALRDPTLIPPEAQIAPDTAGVSTSAAGPVLSEDGLAVVVRNGKPFVIVDTRLYGVGQKIGDSRIERITDTEVWLRNGADRRKLQLYPGIERKTSVPLPPCSAGASKPVKTSKPSSFTSPKAAPCAGAQP